MTEGQKTHRSVLLDEVLQVAAVRPGDRWLDGTFGRGGHSGALLEKGAMVLALDRDDEAGEAAEKLKRRWPNRFEWKQSNFTELKKCCREYGWNNVHGVLLDLGVSSPQIETAERGFSFQLSGPLDMRMDRTATRTAAHLVNEWDPEQLARIFYELGDEKESRRIARALVARRERHPFATTDDLAQVVEKAVGGGRSRKVHPATKVFQALRIAVNGEREALLAALPQATEILETNGLLAVISFHSGEDRMVKHFLRDRSSPWLDTPEHPQSFANEHCYFSKVQRFLPTEKEIDENPRSRSARLRVGRRNETPFHMEASL